MTPAQISLTLSADVLRLPYPPATRMVLAEIVSLYSANAGCCDASDPHFAARLTINKDTVSVAVKLLESDGLVTKVVTPVQGGKYRTLTPNFAAIAAKASTNPYPEVEVNTRRKFRLAQTGNSGLHTPEFPDSHAGISGLHTPEFPDSHAGISGGNNPVNITDNLQGSKPNQMRAADAAVGAEKKIEEVEISSSPAASPTASASHTEGAARVGTRKVTEPTPRQLLLRESPLADFADFAEAWEAAAEANPKTFADFAEANLSHYHAALLDWSNGGNKKKFDWFATIRNSIRNDFNAGKLITYSRPTHGNGSANPNQRPQPGQKPTSDATLVAGALAQRRWQQRNSSHGNQ